MSKVLVTGSTGLIGNSVVRNLLKQNRTVKVLVRSIKKAKKLLPDECEIIKGDITDLQSIENAMKDCSIVYHIAGFPEQWMKDPKIFQSINVEGTRNMITAALKYKVKRFIYTSTIDVFKSNIGIPFDETIIDPLPKETYYSRSKQDADKLVTKALNEGLPAIFLHPSAVYGPGPTDSPGTNDLILKLNNNEVPVLLPGGYPVCFVEDIAQGHILAEQNAKIGSRYILSDTYFTLAQMTELIILKLNLKKKRPPVLPLFIVKIISLVGEFISNITNTPPLIPKGQLSFLQLESRPKNGKIKNDLGLVFTPIEQGLEKTIQYLLK